MKNAGYNNFHGRSPKKYKQWDFHCPRKLIVLGKAVAIEYECNKLNGGGDGTNAIYRHTFKKSVTLAMDEKNKNQ